MDKKLGPPIPPDCFQRVLDSFPEMQLLINWGGHVNAIVVDIPDFVKTTLAIRLLACLPDSLRANLGCHSLSLWKVCQPEYTWALNMSFVGNVKIIHITGLMDSESIETWQGKANLALLQRECLCLLGNVHGRGQTCRRVQRCTACS